MEIIKTLSRLIEDEAEGAEEYMELAIANRTEYPELAQTFYELAQTELGHVHTLHAQAVKLMERQWHEHGADPSLTSI